MFLTKHCNTRDTQGAEALQSDAEPEFSPFQFAVSTSLVLARIYQRHISLRQSTSDLAPLVSCNHIAYSHCCYWHRVFKINPVQMYKLHYELACANSPQQKRRHTEASFLFLAVPSIDKQSGVQANTCNVLTANRLRM